VFIEFQGQKVVVHPTRSKNQWISTLMQGNHG